MTRRGLAAVVVALAAFAVGYAAGRARTTVVPDLSRYDALIEQQAQAFELDPPLLFALVAAESGGNPEAVSSAGAIGLCQLMPATAAEEAGRLKIDGYAPERLTEPALNVRLGASYLRRQLVRFEGDTVFALAAYNAGGTNVRRWQRRAPDVSSKEAVQREGFSETRHYVTRVLQMRDAYSRR